MFKRILVATDRLSGVDAPVLTAIGLARQYHAGLTILHVLESVPSANAGERVIHFNTGAEVEVTAGYLETVRDELQQTYTASLTVNDQAGIRIRIGFPWEEILRTGCDTDSDLIVLGPHSANAEARGIARIEGKIGSTVQAVIAHENCPVMIIGRPVNREKLAFKKIVVGIDFSVSSECALCLSVKFSRNLGSILYPFFMLPVPPYPKYSGVNYKVDIEKLRDKLEDFCDIYLDGIDHDYQLWGGALPHREVLKCAARVDADLIILGSHTKLNSGKWYAGSVVEQVSHSANCPVLCVNDPQALEKWEDIRVRALEGEAPMDRSIHLFNALLSKSGKNHETKSDHI